MLETIVIALVLAIAAVLLAAATRPNAFRVERTLVINAEPAKIYAYIEDFQKWSGWSPWEKMDPDMKRTRSGAPSGKGAVYEWQGNRKVGAGRMEIVDAAAPTRLTVKLDFLRPFEAHNIAEFLLAPQGGATSVTWAMHGPQIFMAKLMGLFVSMDKMIGKDFEAGLANLKALAEQ